MGINTRRRRRARRRRSTPLTRRRRRERPRSRCANVRLLNPTEMLSRFQIDRGVEAGLTIDDLDVDRYDLDVDGAAAAGARSPPASSTSTTVPTRAGRAAPHQHPRLRAGDGAGRPGAARATGRIYQTVELDRPELYFSPSARRGYAVARTDAERAGRAGGDTPTTSARPACGCRRSCAAPPSRWPSSTTTCSARARSTPTRRCCGCATSSDRVRSWRRSCPSTATRTRWSIDGTVQWVVDGYTTTSRYPYAQAHRQRRPAQRRQRPRPRRQLRAQQRQGRRRRLRRLGHVLRRRRRRPDHQGVGVGLPRPVHAARRDAGRAARAPALSRGPVPGADRRVLEVPARRRSTSSSARARGRWPRRRRRPAATVDGGHARRRHGDAGRRPAARRPRHRVVDEPLHPVLHDVRRPTARDEFVLLRPFVPVLARRPAHRAAGVHDRVERPDDVRPAHRLRRRRHRRPAGGPAHDRQLGGGHPRHQRADHVAEPGRRPGCASATSSWCRSGVRATSRRRPALRPPALPDRAAVRRAPHRPSRRTSTSWCRPTTARRCTRRRSAAPSGSCSRASTSISTSAPSGSSTDASTGLPGDTGSTTGTGGPSDATGPRRARRSSCSPPPTGCCARPRTTCGSTATSAAYQDKVDQATDLVTQALTLMGAAPTADTLPALVPTGSVPTATAP